MRHSLRWFICALDYIFANNLDYRGAPQKNLP